MNSLLCPCCRHRLTVEVAPDNRRLGRAACVTCPWRSGWFAFADLMPVRGKRNRQRYRFLS